MSGRYSFFKQSPSNDHGYVSLADLVTRPPYTPTVSEAKQARKSYKNSQTVEEPSRQSFYARNTEEAKQRRLDKMLEDRKTSKENGHPNKSKKRILGIKFK